MTTPGLTPPFVLGWDLAGTVLEDAEGFRAGQRVVGLVPWFGVAKDGIGTHAELLSAEPGWLAPLPEGVDVVEAATLGLNALDRGAGTGPARVARRGDAAGDGRERSGRRVRGAACRSGRGQRAGDRLRPGRRGVPGRDRGQAGAAATAPDELGAVVRAVQGGGVDAVLDAAPYGQPAIATVRDGGAFVSATAPGPAVERGIRVQAGGVQPNASQLAALATDPRPAG